MKKIKKIGGIDMPLSNLAGLIFLIVIIIIAAFYFPRFFNIILPGSITEQSSEQAYENIKNIIENFSESAEQFQSIINTVSLEDSATIVAFNKNEKYSLDACYPKEQVEKPAVCGKDACICYYNPGDDEDFADNSMGKKPCYRFPNVDYIISFYYSDWYYGHGSSYIEAKYGADSSTYKNIEGDKLASFSRPVFYPYDHYAYLLLYGSCDGWTIDQSFGTQNMYFEKFKDPETGKTYILIAKYSDKPAIKERKKSIQSNLQFLNNKTST